MSIDENKEREKVRVYLITFQVKLLLKTKAIVPVLSCLRIIKLTFKTL